MEQISKYSETLADIVALNSKDGIDRVAMKLARRIKGTQFGRNEVGESPVYEQSTSTDYVFLSKWDLSEEDDKFYYTEGIDIDSNGYVYVSEEGNYIRKFDPIGSLVAKWGGKGNKDGEFETAYALAVDLSDNILVSDSRGNIQKFDEWKIHIQMGICRVWRRSILKSFRPRDR